MSEARRRLELAFSHEIVAAIEELVDERVDELVEERLERLAPSWSPGPEWLTYAQAGERCGGISAAAMRMQIKRRPHLFRVRNDLGRRPLVWAKSEGLS